jgi:hypothetical protein
VPSSGPVTQRPSPSPSGPAPETPGASAETTPESLEGENSEGADEPKRVKKLGGFRLFRAAVAANIGYTSGTSDRNGLFDRQKSIDASVAAMMPVMTGGGDLGTDAFGGFFAGGLVDIEVVQINLWAEYQQFFAGGGMWSLLAGYDHEFSLGKRARFDLGAGFGLMKVFLNNALEQFYVDTSDPTQTDLATTGMEVRGMATLPIKLFGPVFTGPTAMLGYHYLFSANDEAVVAEKGLHFSAAWTVRLDFSLNRRKKNPDYDAEAAKKAKRAKRAEKAAR